MNSFDKYKDEVKYDYIIEGSIDYIMKELDGNKEPSMDQQIDSLDNFEEQVEGLLNDEDYLKNFFPEVGLERVYTKLTDIADSLSVKFGISVLEKEEDFTEKDLKEDAEALLKDICSDLDPVSVSGIGDEEPMVITMKPKGEAKIEVVETTKEESLDLTNADKILVSESILKFKKENKSQTLILDDDGIIKHTKRNKLVKSVPFSKAKVTELCKEIINEGYSFDPNNTNLQKMEKDLEKNISDVDKVQDLKDELEDKMDKLVNEDFPKSDYTDKVLTYNEIKKSNFDKNLTEDQKTWIKNNLDYCDNLQEAMLSLYESVDTTSPLISINDYVNLLKDNRKIVEGKLIKDKNDNVNIEVDYSDNDTLDNIKEEDKKSFEDFKKLYKGIIDMKFRQNNGDKEDKNLWEETAKELFLKSKNYVLKGTEYNTKETFNENKKLNELKKDKNSKDIDYFKPGQVNIYKNYIGKALGKFMNDNKNDIGTIDFADDGQLSKNNKVITYNIIFKPINKDVDIIDIDEKLKKVIKEIFSDVAKVDKDNIQVNPEHNKDKTTFTITIPGRELIESKKESKMMLQENLKTLKNFKPEVLAKATISAIRTGRITEDCVRFLLDRCNIVNKLQENKLQESEESTLSSLFDSLNETPLDTEYREAFAQAEMKYNYVPEGKTPYDMANGSDEEKAAYEEIQNRPLTSAEVIQILDFIDNEMKDDYQYDTFKRWSDLIKYKLNK